MDHPDGLAENLSGRAIRGAPERRKMKGDLHGCSASGAARLAPTLPRSAAGATWAELV